MDMSLKEQILGLAKILETFATDSKAQEEKLNDKNLMWYYRGRAGAYELASEWVKKLAEYKE